MSLIWLVVPLLDVVLSAWPKICKHDHLTKLDSETVITSYEAGLGRMLFEIKWYNGACNEMRMWSVVILPVLPPSSVFVRHLLEIY